MWYKMKILDERTWSTWKLYWNTVSVLSFQHFSQVCVWLPVLDETCREHLCFKAASSPKWCCDLHSQQMTSFSVRRGAFRTANHRLNSQLLLKRAYVLFFIYLFFLSLHLAFNSYTDPPEGKACVGIVTCEETTNYGWKKNPIVSAFIHPAWTFHTRTHPLREILSTKCNKTTTITTNSPLSIVL